MLNARLGPSWYEFVPTDIDSNINMEVFARYTAFGWTKLHTKARTAMKLALMAEREHFEYLSSGEFVLGRALVLNRHHRAKVRVVR